MTEVHSTRPVSSRKPRKPKKPYPDFPLFPHATRRWAKKIKGRTRYFGPWADPTAALNKYLEQKDDLHAGRTPRVQGDGLTVRDLCNRFLTAKRLEVEGGTLSPRTWADYHDVCEHVIKVFGLTRLVDDLAADDFERLKAHFAKSNSPVTVGNRIQRCKVMFNYAVDAGLIDRPLRFGKSFRRPRKSILRIERAKQGKKLFSPQQMRAMIRKAGQPMRAMILLGVNAGLGNADCGRLERRHVNLATGWLDFSRPKTGIPRRCLLWPETVDAIRQALQERPQHRDEAHADLVFLTQTGRPWFKDTRDNPVSQEFKKLLKRLKLTRGGFYWLRHTLATIGGESRDEVAVRSILGHVDNTVTADYRESVSDDRLRDVVNHVHGQGQLQLKPDSVATCTTMSASCH